MTHAQTGTGRGFEPRWCVVPLAVAVSAVLSGSAVVAVGTPAAGFLYAAGAMLGLLPMAAVVARGAPDRARPAGFGAANWTTLLRSVLTALAAGAVAAPEALAGNPAHGWLPTLAVTLGLLLDMADGRLARSRRQTSEFGARFDLEADAWTTLVLAGLAVALDAAPAWVLAIGLLHYLYRAAALAMPALSAPLPPSLRRRLVGGAQMIALAVLLAPALPSGTAATVAAIALSALLLSFGLDVRWLLRASATNG